MRRVGLLFGIAIVSVGVAISGGFGEGLPIALAQADIGARLMQAAAVKAAIAAARDDEAQTLEDQVRLCEIPAPPFKETARGKVYADDFRKLV